MDLKTTSGNLDIFSPGSTQRENCTGPLPLVCVDTTYRACTKDQAGIARHSMCWWALPNLPTDSLSTIHYNSSLPGFMNDCASLKLNGKCSIYKNHVSTTVDHQRHP